MPTNNDPLNKPAARDMASWADAMALRLSFRRRPVGPPSDKPSEPAPAQEAMQAESSVSRLLRLIERVVEVCP